MGMDRLLERLRTGDGVLRVSEVAELLECSPSYVYKLIRARAIDFGRVGSDYRVPVQEARRLAREAGVLRE